jgi:hypothetical protein
MLQWHPALATFMDICLKSYSNDFLFVHFPSQNPIFNDNQAQRPTPLMPEPWVR